MGWGNRGLKKGPEVCCKVRSRKVECLCPGSDVRAAGTGAVPAADYTREDQ